MNSSISKKCYVDKMTLYFDCLTPEEAYKIMDCLFESRMDSILCDYMMDVNLGYAVTGYRPMNGGEGKRYSHELVLSIEMPKAVKLENGSSIEEQLEDDRQVLSLLRRAILRTTSLKEEES